MEGPIIKEPWGFLPFSEPWTILAGCLYSELERYCLERKLPIREALLDFGQIWKEPHKDRNQKIEDHIVQTCGGDDKYFGDRTFAKFGEDIVETIISSVRVDDVMLFHGLYKGRPIMGASDATLKAMHKNARKLWERGQGEQELLLARDHTALRGHVSVPFRIPNAHCMEIVGHNPYVLAIQQREQKASDKFLKSGKSMDELEDISLNVARELLTSYRMFEVSDTPVWVKPTKELSLLLLNTELKGVRGKDLKLPFPGFYIKPPKGLLCTKGSIEVAVGAVSVHREYPTEHDEGQGKSIVFRLHLFPRDRIKYNEPSKLTPLPHIILPIFDDEAPIKVSGELIYADPTKKADYYVAGQKVPSPEEFYTTIVAFCLNLILYINSPKADVKKVGIDKKKKTKKTKKTKSKGGKKVSALRCEDWITGTSVKLTKEGEKALKESISGSKRSVSYTYAVRGHWRNQACGEGRTERKRMWIKPQIRNKKDFASSVIGHTYKT